jgi:hypothetical protein
MMDLVLNIAYNYVCTEAVIQMAGKKEECPLNLLLKAASYLQSQQKLRTHAQACDHRSSEY